MTPMDLTPVHKQTLVEEIRHFSYRLIKKWPVVARNIDHVEIDVYSWPRIYYYSRDSRLIFSYWASTPSAPLPIEWAYLIVYDSKGHAKKIDFFSEVLAVFEKLDQERSIL